MIYVYSDNYAAAVRYIVTAQLKGAHLVGSAAGSEEGRVYTEDDEIYIIHPVNRDLYQSIRRNYGRVYPRPHIFKELSDVDA